MSESPTTSAKAPDVIQDPEPTVAEDRVFQAPVLVTEQEVMFSTAAAVPMPPTTITRRLIDAIRHYPQRFSYLDRALMAREMYRL
ncbi:MAG: hypothetical protein QOG75_1650 [Mycobacterium sp.]|jgi:hypothetical protein|nr:hypothetical protein [Mycobacterium sp.]